MAKPSTASTTPAAAKAAQAARVAPVLTAVSTTVPMPERNSNRGSKTSYPFSALTAAGMSFGVKNKTAANLASIVSNQNRKPGPIKRDASGNVIFKTKPMTDASGAVIGNTPTTEPEHMDGPKYFAVDCEPKTDPDGASARVFRQS